MLSYPTGTVSTVLLVLAGGLLRPPDQAAAVLPQASAVRAHAAWTGTAKP